MGAPVGNHHFSCRASCTSHLFFRSPASSKMERSPPITTSSANQRRKQELGGPALASPGGDWQSFILPSGYLTSNPVSLSTRRLQGELQKSRETGAELCSLDGSMNGIYDALDGALVSISAVSLYCRYWP